MACVGYLLEFGADELGAKHVGEGAAQLYNTISKERLVSPARRSRQLTLNSAGTEQAQNSHRCVECL